MSLTKLDIVVLIPVVPLFPFVVTWCLPWEKWIPWGKIPKHIGGPYFLYVAFVGWYFKMDLWFVGLLLILGAVVCFIAAWEFKHRYKRPT